MKVKNCRVCGSGKIMADVSVIDTGQNAKGSLMIIVYKKPGALIFKDRHFETLKAWVCGECGYTQFFAEKPKWIYEVYKASQGE